MKHAERMSSTDWL